MALVSAPDPISHCQPQPPIILINRTVYLSSLASAAQSGCGASNSPWTVEALPGQRINITLVDFTPESSKVTTSRGGGGGGDGFTCRVYATIREWRRGRRRMRSSSTICGGTGRTRAVHVTSDATTEIRLIGGRRQLPGKTVNFLLKLEGQSSSLRSTYLLIY